MVELIIQAGIGLFAGLMGGLLGVGGSMVIIPGLILYLSWMPGGYVGNHQHLVQAAAMICNVFVATPAVLAHRRAGMIMPQVVKVLIPTALGGIIAGVTLSNCSFFAKENGYFLAFILGGFMVYMVVYNLMRFFSKTNFSDAFDADKRMSAMKVAMTGIPMGVIGGLLGIGGGAICVPLQQLILRIPLRRAISNSATTIMCIAIFGSTYKCLTLGEHGMSGFDAVKLAGMIVPTAMVGSYFGGKLTHKLPRKALRITYITFLIVVAYLTFSRAVEARDKALGKDVPVSVEPQIDAVNK